MLQRGVLSAISADEFAQGTIIEIEERLPGEAYDPWQSITVLWDDDWSHLQLRSKVRGDHTHCHIHCLSLLSWKNGPFLAQLAASLQACCVAVQLLCGWW
jgi:hypothetical protein